MNRAHYVTDLIPGRRQGANDFTLVKNRAKYGDRRFSAGLRAGKG